MMADEQGWRRVRGFKEGNPKASESSVAAVKSRRE
jgi:hypothetical protein